MLTWNNSYGSYPIIDQAVLEGVPELVEGRGLYPIIFGQGLVVSG
ncbi:MAG TPA: hypothetical protein V6C95_18365 [Coleofasciculaceae cyanobacterium]